MTTSAHPRQLRADAARNRRALMDAAERLFAARGLCVTLDDIAAEAGVNVATAYRHFANKHELIAASLRQKIDQAVLIAEEAAGTEDPWEGLIQFLERTLALMTENRALHDVFLPGQGGDWLERLEERMQPVVSHLLLRAREAGEVRSELEPGDLGVALQMLATVGDVPVAEPPALLRRYLELLLAGMRPSDTPLPGSAPSPSEVLAAMPEARNLSPRLRR
jgi:AcrR family transcriptional regulator